MVALQKSLPHASFTAQGGGQIETDPEQRSGLLAKDPQLKMYLRLVHAEGPRRTRGGWACRASGWCCGSRCRASRCWCSGWN